MSDRPPRVFISYSHLDEAWKDRLVRHLRVLAVEGEIELWHDRLIEAGGAWKERIDEAIDRSDVAILLVSADFLTSAFIREKEISRILARRASQGLRVVPVIVRPCAWMKVAWLRDIQARPLDGRTLSEGTEHQIDKDLAALALEVLSPAPPAAPPVRTRWHKSRKRGLALLPATLVAALVIASMVVRVTTPLELDALARAVAFTVAGDAPVLLLNNSTVFSRLVVEGCDTVSFPPVHIGIGDMAPVALPSALNFRCDRRVPGSKVVVRGPGTMPSQEVGRLNPIVATPGDRVSFELTDASPPELRLEVSRKASFDFSIKPDVPFEIVSEFADADAPSLPASAGGIATYRASIPGANAVRVATVEASRGLNIIVAPAQATDVEQLFRPDFDFPIESLSLFQRSDVDDRLVSTALSGTLRYPERPDLGSIKIDTGETVALGGVGVFRLTKLWINGGKQGLGFRVHGQATQVSTGSQDRRLTLFDRARRHSSLLILGLVAFTAVQWTWGRMFGVLSRRR